jgi:hypothetical protein
LYIPPFPYLPAAIKTNLMTREERLEFCTVCTHRKLNLQQGLLCGLTNEVATFEGRCADQVVDEKERENALKRKLAAAGNERSGSNTNPDSNKMNGTILIVVAIVLEGALVFLLDRISLWPVVIAAYGIWRYNKGVQQEKIIREAREKELKG